MSRVGLLCSEALGERAAGIGIRYLEIARRLPAFGFEVVLVSPWRSDRPPALANASVEVHRFDSAPLAELFAGCAAVVAQGQLANDLLEQLPDLPAVIDLYDPFLVENLTHFDSLGLDPYRNDHRTWVRQLSGGDFFLCSSAEQRSYYLGFLTALGRVNPHRYRDDPELTGLIAEAPFGVPDPLPAYQPLMPTRAEGERRILFGGLYDWYDPEPLLKAFARLPDPDARLLFVRQPPGALAPQRLLAEVEARSLRLDPERIQFLDWVPHERRYDLLRDVDALAACHRPGLETDLSLRTRFVDALAVGCPVLTTEGGTVPRLLRDWDAGLVVPCGDVEALRDGLAHLVAGGPAVEARALRGRERTLAAFSWERSLTPLVAFLSSPKTDSTKREFSFQPRTAAPDDEPGFRLRRFIRTRLVGAPATGRG